MRKICLAGLAALHSQSIMTFRFLILSFFLSLVILTVPSPANASFDAWLYKFVQDARSEGIRDSTIREAMDGVTPNQRVIELDRKQPEGTMTFAQYRKKIISQSRIDKGRIMFARHRDLLTKIGKRYGVQPQYIVALWGVETSYGANTGGFDIVEALMTLAYDGRRSDYFRKELINALKIYQKLDIPRDEFKGSWAGAMGQCQFMPSSYLAYAADGNYDGQKDIWRQEADVFASAANYLKQRGWRAGQRWGRAVTLPTNFDQDLVGRKKTKPLRDWALLGVRQSNGMPLILSPGMEGAIVQPDGAGTPAFLVYNNFNTILRWNNSSYFGLSVGMLADAIAKG